MTVKLTLSLAPGNFAVCQLGPRAAVPVWAVQSAYFSITRTPDELSLVCPEDALPRDPPAGMRIERGWRVLTVAGPLDFALTGILLAIAQPLAEAGVGIFALSTFDTDHVLVRETQLQPAITALARAGHTVREPAGSMLVKFGWRLPNGTPFNAHFNARIAAYEPEQDRWIAMLEDLVALTDTVPAAVGVRVRALSGKWVRVPNEARMGMTLPLKFETLAGKVKFFYDADPRLP